MAEAERVVQQSGNALRVRHGGQPWPVPPPTAFPQFCLAQDPSGLWVAQDGDTIVGFGFSWMTEKFWFFSQLFVRPETPAKGIGQALLSKTLMQAERNEAANRALITPHTTSRQPASIYRPAFTRGSRSIAWQHRHRLSHKTLPMPVTTSHRLRSGPNLANGLLANGLAGSIESCSGSAAEHSCTGDGALRNLADHAAARAALMRFPPQAITSEIASSLRSSQ